MIKKTSIFVLFVSFGMMELLQSKLVMNVKSTTTNVASAKLIQGQILIDI